MRRGAFARTWAELTFGVGSWLALGRPWTCPASLPTFDGALRSAAWERCIERSAALIRSAVSSGSGGEALAGGGRRSQLLLREARDQETKLEGVFLEQNAYDKSVTTAVRVGNPKGGPKRIEAAKISMPARACTWDIAKHLSGETLDAFLEPRTLAVPPRETFGPPRVYGSAGEVLAMFKRFDEADMLYIANPSELPRGRGGGPVSSGFFVEPKPDGTDRTLQDRRAPNAGERRLKKACRKLPHGSCFTEIQLREGHTTRGHGDDLPDCYHSVFCSDSRAASNAIGEARPLADFAGTKAAAAYRERYPGARDEDLVYACNRALPMGDGNAVEFVQSAHLRLLQDFGVAQESELLEYRQPVPRSAVWEAVMIDDHSVVAQVPKAAVRTSTDRDSEILACADAAYKSDGLSPKPSKRVRDAEDFQTMGAAILGSQHFVSASIPSILNTLGVTEWILRNGAATTALWEGSVGLWVNILLYAREGFSLVRRVFRGKRHRAREDLSPVATRVGRIEGAGDLRPVLRHRHQRAGGADDYGGGRELTCGGGRFGNCR